MVGEQDFGGIQLLNILEEHEKPITAIEIAHKLDLPLGRIMEDLNMLKTNGIVREARIEQLIEEGK